MWPGAALVSKALPDDPDLTMDWIRADAGTSPEKLFLLSTGEHGVEGYVGAVILSLFVKEFLPRLDPANTGIVLVHPINPWGMQQQRRTNAHNVDLNRNFVWEIGNFQTFTNPGYEQIKGFLNPQRELGPYPWVKAAFLFRLLKTILAVGRERLQNAALLGQYHYPRGIYYGGDKVQFETQVMQDLYCAAFKKYRQIVHVDIHTGYGPRGQMTLVNSPLESRTPAQLSRLIDYPHIVAANPEQFYDIRGDMIDWCYTMMKQAHPHKEYYGTAFEFGTAPHSLAASITSLRAVVFENQAYWHGTSHPGDRAKLRREYLEQYAPQEEAWVKRAVLDAKRAFQGILDSYNFLK